MENFNKNWLAILLIAVVFGTLGFLLGRTTGHDRPQRMMWTGAHGGNEFQLKVDVDDMEGDGNVTIDTLMKDGQQIIIKKIKKAEMK